MVSLSTNPPSKGGLTIWVVYDHPKDFPDHYVARRFINEQAQNGEGDVIVKDDLIEIRNAMYARGLFRLGRDPSDDPVIVEMWL